MFKKMLSLIIFIILFNISIVYAKNFECYYQNDAMEGTLVPSSIFFTLIVDTDDSSLSIEGGEEKNSVGLSVTFNLDKLKKSWFEQENSDSCLGIFLCWKKESSGTNNMPKMDYDVYLFSNETEASEVIGEYEVPVGMGVEGKYYCTTYVKEETDCDMFYKTRTALDDYYKGYTECKTQGCYNIYLQKINQEKEQIKKYCKSVLSTLDYSSECSVDCLEINKYLKEHYNTDESYNNGECGLGQKLIKWIGNIVRWGKYLIPVIVIVLGILDFIKAIAADKDDEMKKAQGRFVKRLIAAALIFIIPFIIEFVLVKLGFNSNGCGIIDL